MVVISIVLCSKFHLCLEMKKLNAKPNLAPGQAAHFLDLFLTGSIEEKASHPRLLVCLITRSR